ncbi:G-type lectin S-receptor-like serine/threonine-protein kinase At4g27290 [Syzygium oleosum]|uniref:G-type lectin S-receptor-like serine/threonine-protein kinase At4g27290 n=1 Tax=Syzygium oleosum TaxID=219896 RepID=UPI0024B9F0F9|nr:G-type lectin S-receptor-like serine/threonine-protein kinase At4g27290 [Syzygium oleosum]
MGTVVGALIIFLYFTSSTITGISGALDTLTTDQSMQHGKSIVSAGGTFELGFFSLHYPPKHYLGIWYKKINPIKVVWVANRACPLTDSSGTLKFTRQGSLILLDGNETEIWCSNSSKASHHPVAQLLDSGNLVVRDLGNTGSDNMLWQSFDYPTDTFLAGMKLGRNRITGFDRYLTSWKSVDDPSPGNFSFQVDPNGFPQILLKQGSTVKSRLRPWIGVRNGGTQNLNLDLKYTYEFVLTEQEMYCHYQFFNRSVISRLYLNPDGVVQRFTWVDQTQSWVLFLVGPSDDCDLYTYCGASSSCNINKSPACQCLNGFSPKVPQERSTLNRIGCVRMNSLDCRKDIFRKYPGLKLPDTRSSWFDRSMDLQVCEEVCKRNCSCMAYSNIDPEGGGNGCLLWFGDLIDIREYDEGGQDLYVRMFDLDPGHSSQKKEKLILGSIAVTLLLFLGLSLMVYVQKKKHLQVRRFNSVFSGGISDFLRGSENVECSGEDPELPLFEFATIADATNNFSTDNKLGEGGFGPVYRGMLKNSREVAVKKLSRSSGQGLDEFKSEALHLAKLQHRNLVKLLGCCIQKEMLLIYEYMPNKSLDTFIFDQEQRKLLDWRKRFHIISGVTRGLLYLHQDSRLRIIHRDLKASNVLLDCELNAKISDFGLAKSFGGNETEACTKRVAGTYGYMSPEYAIDGVS